MKKVFKVWQAINKWVTLLLMSALIKRDVHGNKLCSLLVACSLFIVLTGKHCFKLVYFPDTSVDNHVFISIAVVSSKSDTDC